MISDLPMMNFSQTNNTLPTTTTNNPDKRMKTPLPKYLKLMLAMCIMAVASAAFGQATLVWTNQINDLQINSSTNWDPNQQPSPTVGPDANGYYGDILT